MRVLASLVAVLLIAVSPASASNNVALVIGNGAYQHTPQLANPVNDARAVAAELERQDFEVMLATDLDFIGMLSALREFRSKADRADIAMVYYAGHGIEVGGENFLIPVDARMVDERDAPSEATRLDDVLRQISGARKMRMIVLDACRDNPFATTMKSKGRGRSVGRGLGRVEPDQSNTLIAYAAAAGAITPDGQPGTNSPFTEAFLAAMKDQPRDVRLMFGAVRDEMRRAVGPQVEPFVYASLGADSMILNPNSGRGAPPPQDPIFSGGAGGSDASALLTDGLDALFGDPKPAPAPKPDPLAALDPDPQPPIAVTPQPPAIGMAQIIEAQALLLTMDVPVGIPDGQLNPATVAGLKQFQRENRLPETGEPDMATLVSLRTAARLYERFKSERQPDPQPDPQPPVVVKPDPAPQPSFPPTELAFLNRAIPGTTGVRPFDRMKDCRWCPEMIVMPGGSFTMGSPPSETNREATEGPQRRVAVTPFALSRTEVTFREWEACVADGGCQSNKRPDDGGYGRGDRPVINVSWNDAQEYITWLNGKVEGDPYRLPTEAEWEFAARAGTGGPFSFDGPITVQRANYNGKYSYEGSPTGLLRNATVEVNELNAENPWGLRHMHGNVWEWMQDCWHPSYDGAPSDARAWGAENGGNCGQRVLRSGSFYLDPKYLRSAARIGLATDHRSIYRGIRVAKALVSTGAGTITDTTPDEIREAQEMLARLGFDAGTPNGVFSDRTASALREFQRATDGLAATGTLNRQTMVALRAATRFATAPVAPPVTVPVAPSGQIPGTRYQALDHFKECRFCPEMVALPAGEFTMGSPPTEELRLDNEGPQRRVRLGAFALAAHEVSFEQWDACAAAGFCRSNPRPDDAGFGRGKQPVINISWNDAKEFIEWLNTQVSGRPYRLPTEAEWEYAARAGTSGPFSFSGPISTDRVNYDGRKTYMGSAAGPLRNKTVAVDALEANPWGFHNIHGNVWEWLEDCWHDSYAGAPSDGRAWGSENGGNCQRRMLRSGSYYLGPQYQRVAARIGLDVTHRSTYRGLRPARTLP